MVLRVGVAGASGYAGGEVLRLLAQHPGVEIGAVTAYSQVGETLGSVHPHLGSLADRVFVATAPQALAGHDVVILALPHGASGPLAADLPDDVLVIDCGADHRLASSKDWERFYGGDHPGTWTYGLPELITGSSGAEEPLTQRHLIRNSRRIAVPGCNVTAVTLALGPGIASGLLEAQDLVAVLANGPSGAGRALKPHLLASEILGSASPYQVGGVHRHIPEILQNLRAANPDAEPTISFTPTLVPMARGILATVTARLTTTMDDDGPLRDAYTRAYAGERFVTFLPPGQWPSTAATLGANTAHLQLALDRDAKRAVIVAAIDNLVKGTAGAAIQCLNIASGFPEETGLTLNGVAP
ncbi:MAG: N-acetyl-gamma-glutamyl-phosphate reductase [Micrococcales bacterium]|nr:N-acetyl-gamma-glutamyl-phosphate reductase [Micrococcales bacterium]